MQILLKHPIKNREKIANIISCIIQGESVDNVPYTVNSGDSCWVADVGNNWHLEFFDENEKKLRIDYRYSNSEHNEKETALINWVCEVLNAKII